VIDLFEGANRFLSNFHEHPITYNGVIYPSSEHAYQAAKFADVSDRQHVAAMPTPNDSKEMGRKADLSKLSFHWDTEKYGIMREILSIKFELGTELASRLMDTGDHALVEGNYWHDTYWGVCYGKCRRGPHSADGTNHLGVLLMCQREELFSLR